jgi:DNA-binding MarR family transcriptional regulator
VPITRRRKPTPRRNGAAEPFAAPLTTTREALLVGGSDAAFRELIGNLMTMAHQLTTLRAHLARRLGVSEPEYRVFLAIAQLQDESGVSVAAVARHLKVAGAFVTMIVQRLARSGYVEKKPSHIDRRGVLLRLSPQGERMMAAFAAEPKAINDELFGDIDRGEFEALCRVARRIVAGGERALMVSRLRELGPAQRQDGMNETRIRGDEHDETTIRKR